MLGSSAAGKIADQAVRDAWRSFSGQSWTTLMGEDRDRRGPVESEPPDTAGDAEADTSQYGDFMGKVARSRPRRPPPGG
jgi:hypothetical protein